MKPKNMTEAQFLDLLQKVLPKATTDPRVASTIYDQVAKEIRIIQNLKSFDAFCAEGSLPNLEKATVAEFRSQLEINFGEKGDSVGVEIVLPDRTINNRIRVLAPGEAEAEEVKVPMVPFPVALPEDPGLIWVLARREDLPPPDAARALGSIEEEFWETKTGLKLQQKGTEKSFAEFIAHVPAAALAESGIKRHYKEPEALKTLTRLAPRSAERIEPESQLGLAS
jgi:hypothetical protein